MFNIIEMFSTPKWTKNDLKHLLKHLFRRLGANLSKI